MTAKATCEDVLPLLAPYADDSLADTERARVAAHVLTCPACRAWVAMGRQTRELLRQRAADLRSTAPPSLRRRLEQVRDRAVPSASRRPRWSLRWVPLPAAAAIVLALLGVAAVGALAPHGTVLAAQLGLDHLKCLILADRHHGADAASLAAGWYRDRGWAIQVPPSSAPDGLELVALRRCLYVDGDMAHVVYERGGRSVSLFILPRPREAGRELEIMGLGTVAWSRDGRTYALVGKAPLKELSALAAYMRPLAR
jgi:anti-sigma factor RsiW